MAQERANVGVIEIERPGPVPGQWIEIADSETTAVETIKQPDRTPLYLRDLDQVGENAHFTNVHILSRLTFADKPLSATEIAQRLSISVKTARQRVWELRQSHYPIESARGKTGGYFIAPHNKPQIKDIIQEVVRREREGIVARNVGTHEEIEIVLSAQLGDEDAQQKLYDIYFARVFHYILARIGGLEDAQDLANDVFEKMIEALPRYYFRDQTPFSAWVFRIARNAVVSQRRRKNVRNNPLPIDNELPASQNVEEEVEKRIQIEQAFQCAIYLPPAQKEVIFLRFKRGLSYTEVAEILGKTITNVKVTQHTAIARLREMMGIEVSTTTKGKRPRQINFDGINGNGQERIQAIEKAKELALAS